MHAAKTVADVVVAGILSYGVWGVVGLNGWTAALRQRNLFHMYQAFFVPLLVLFLAVYLLLRRERGPQMFSLFAYGIGVGYGASLLALCLWPLIAHNGWNKFLRMGWGLSELPVTGFIIGGWLNGLIMAGVLWLVKWGNGKQKVGALALVAIIAVVRLVFVPESLMRDLWPPS